MPPTTKTPPVALIYVHYFRTIEPILALVGAYLAHSSPGEFLQTMSPASFVMDDSSLSSSSSSQATQLLLSTLSATYFLFALNEALVLRATRNLSVWRSVQLSYMVCDVGHLYAIYVLCPSRFWAVAAWTARDWTNLGVLWFDVSLRAAFLVGIGVGKSAV